MMRKRLFLQTANVVDERVDLFFGKLLAKRGHFLPLAVVYRVEEALVADAVLPLTIREVARLNQFHFKGFCSSIFPVAIGALLLVDCSASLCAFWFVTYDGL